MEFGYKISSEEHNSRDLVRYARLAEKAGFSFGMISDHYHPWTDKQGESPFVWGVLGAIAQATDHLKVGTGVTCPTIRIHPAIVAQAAATAAELMPGRFFLGIGSGEHLNEHVLGDKWPEAPVRIEMMEEAVEVIRLLWEGGLQSHRGKHYTVENARIYSLPDELPPIYIAAGGKRSAEVAARVGDGLVSTSPDDSTIKAFEAAGGTGPRYAEVQVCWAEDAETAKKIAHEWWPNTAMGGQLSQELSLPSLFEAVAENVSPDDVAESVALGPDPDEHLRSIGEYVDAGYDHVYVHQIGPDQEGFFEFYRDEVLPKLL
ncbi:MAG TPA: TIGR03557 family F420-dependent LLM class oxidoreductase [Actinomycetota bacterium]|nr:TIGR03557 family F420-dependent LLM class oxidoreductase [Actinomycetota bacterium]